MPVRESASEARVGESEKPAQAQRLLPSSVVSSHSRFPFPFLTAAVALSAPRAFVLLRRRRSLLLPSLSLAFHQSSCRPLSLSLFLSLSHDERREKGVKEGSEKRELETPASFARYICLSVAFLSLASIFSLSPSHSPAALACSSRFHVREREREREKDKDCQIVSRVRCSKTHADREQLRVF